LRYRKIKLIQIFEKPLKHYVERISVEKAPPKKEIPLQISTAFGGRGLGKKYTTSSILHKLFYWSIQKRKKIITFVPQTEIPAGPTRLVFYFELKLGHKPRCNNANFAKQKKQVCLQKKGGLLCLVTPPPARPPPIPRQKEICKNPGFFTNIESLWLKIQKTFRLST